MSPKMSNYYGFLAQFHTTELICIKFSTEKPSLPCQISQYQSNNCPWGENKTQNRSSQLYTSILLQACR